MSPTEIIRRELQRSMRDDARIAAMILLAEPERIGEERIGDFLLRIKCIEFDTVYEWLERAGVNPWRAGNKLSTEQRRRLARELTDFWKAGNGVA